MLATKQNSPHIFFAAGVVGIVGATVLACRATLKLEKTIDEIRDDFGTVPELKHSAAAIVKDDEVIVERQHYYRNMSFLYGKATFKMAKLYGPSVALGAGSIALLTGSHVQLTKRNTALTATLAAAMQAYQSYRERVQEEIGKERELEIYRDIREEQIEMEGHNKKVVVPVTDPNNWSPYAKFFDEYSPNWQKDPELNRIFIQCQQNYYNHQLQARGHVFLNEVYDALGIERTKAGSVVGWVNDGEGDGYIDFGLFQAYNSRFVNNMEPSIILDFNVDGPIWNKLKE